MKKKPDHQNERDDHTDRYFDLAVHAARSQTDHEAPIPHLRPCTSGNSLRTELRAQTRIPSPTSNAGAVRPMIGLVPIVTRTRSGRRLVMVGMGGDYRDYVDSLMHKVPSDTSRSLTDVFKIFIADDYSPLKRADGRTCSVSFPPITDTTPHIWQVVALNCPLRVLPESLKAAAGAYRSPFRCAKDDMEYLPPVVVEHVLPSDFDAGWIISRLYFRREKESVGLDFDSRRGALIGARYGDTAHIVTGAAHDNRWTVKFTVPF